jgi:integrase
VVEDLRDHAGLAPGALDSADVDAWLNGLARDARDRGRPGWARTCNKKRTMAGGLFRFLRLKRRIPANPFEAVEAFVEREPVRRLLRPEEYAAVWRACEPSLRDLLDFLLATGCRISEAVRMRRADLAGGIWLIPRRKARDVLRLALPAAVQALIERQPPGDPVWRRWVPRRPGTGPGHGFREGTAVDTAWLDAALRARCAAAGVPAFGAHALRHAAAGWARAAGLPALWIRDTLGHSTVVTTERYAGQAASREVGAVIEAVWAARSAALGVECVSEVGQK